MFLFFIVLTAYLFYRIAVTKGEIRCHVRYNARSAAMTFSAGRSINSEKGGLAIK